MRSFQYLQSLKMYSNKSYFMNIYILFCQHYPKFMWHLADCLYTVGILTTIVLCMNTVGSYMHIHCQLIT